MKKIKLSLALLASFVSLNAFAGLVDTSFYPSYSNGTSPRILCAHNSYSVLGLIIALDVEARTNHAAELVSAPTVFDTQEMGQTLHNVCVTFSSK